MVANYFSVDVMARRTGVAHRGRQIGFKLRLASVITLNHLRKTMKKIISITLFASVLALSAPSFAQFAKPEDAVKYRKSALFVMQQNFGRLAAMASGKMPFDAKVAADSAVVADFVGRLPWAAFGDGTDKGDTRAKPEIWKEKAKFNEYAEKMNLEMSKLAAAAKTGNLDSIKTSVASTGGTCKTCHDAYRKD